MPQMVELSRWCIGIAACLALAGCDPIRRYQAPGRALSALPSPRNEGVGEQTYEISLSPEVTYRLHAHWFGGAVNLLGELENHGTVPMIVDDRQATLQVAGGLRVRAGTLTPGTELLVGELLPGERHKTRFKFSVPDLETAADLTFMHQGLTLTTGEALRMVVQLIDESGK
jgi:hypothetical protein